MDFWKHLPGPSEFVSEIIENIRVGKNTVICLPKHSPYGLKNALKSALDEIRILEWTPVSVHGIEANNPVRFLYRYFIDENSPGTFLTPGILIKEEHFSGKLIVIDSIHPDNWPNWKAFLLQYQECCRGQNSEFDHTLFCIIVEGEAAITPPPEDLRLEVLKFDGKVSFADALIYSSYTFKKHGITALQKQLAVSVLANVSMWDTEICDRLCDEKIERIFEPSATLKEIAFERNWDSLDSSVAVQWYQGMSGTFNTSVKINSVILSIIGATSEITKRLWTAQVGVLLPFIEEKRHELLAKYKQHMKLPFETKFAVIEELYDLEIGHIEAQLYNCPVDNQIKIYVGCLKKVRNALSHLETVDALTISKLE